MRVYIICIYKKKMKKKNCLFKLQNLPTSYLKRLEGPIPGRGLQNDIRANEINT